MNKAYSYKEHSKDWVNIYKEKKYYLPNYDRPERYCITIPPPNITGRLHMGHAFQCTLMDLLMRYHMIRGYNTLWKFGTDHAGIATQILLEQKFGTSNVPLLKKKAKSWKIKAIDNIKNQIQDLGFLINWDTTRFTLDAHFSYAVKYAFINLYKNNLIYKDTRLVNWDMQLRTAISDLETIYKNVISKLYYIKYFIEGSDKYLVIATTRPETIFADVAIAINSNDDRYVSYIGKSVLVPFLSRVIPIILDDNVDINFGTGCLKITPAHDFKDFEIGKLYNLPIINIFTDNGLLNLNVPFKYQGLSIMDARKSVVLDLKNGGYLLDVLEYNNKIPIGDRTGNVIEPFLTTQWYISVKKLLPPVYDALNRDDIKIIPVKWKKIFINWLDNMKDWCISRQIWWGHRLPVWYDNDNNCYVGNSVEEIIKANKLHFNIELRQETDVLDTWFSSALWPFASLGWPNKKIEFKNFYPTSMLVTGFDIIFFWVIRMIMFGLYFTNTVPFKEIYVHGLIRDHKGVKMSKTKGNVIDPLDVVHGISNIDLKKKYTDDLMNFKLKKLILRNIDLNYPDGIKSYGVDALRLCLVSMATSNISLKMDLRNVEKYKNFCNKLWHASEFLKNKKCLNNVVRRSLNDIYILYSWNEIKSMIIDYIEQREFSKAIECIYNFFWLEFCDWFIELSKFLFLSKKYNVFNVINIQSIFKEFLIILHPFAPIITEEIWYKNYNKNTVLINESYPQVIEKKLFYNFDSVEKLKQFIYFARKNALIKNIYKELFIFIEKFLDLILIEKILGYICKILKLTKVILIYSKNGVSSEKCLIFNEVFFVFDKKVAIELIPSSINPLLLKKIDVLKNLLNNDTFIKKAPADIVNMKIHELKILLAKLKE